MNNINARLTTRTHELKDASTEWNQTKDDDVYRNAVLP